MKNISKSKGYLIVIVFWIIVTMFMLNIDKSCCERTVQEVYEYEGLYVDCADDACEYNCQNYIVE